MRLISASSWSPTKHPWLAWAALVAVVVGLANFFWFMAESASLRGDALNGVVRDGHHYVSNHGTLTEVSPADWRWSRAHGISVIGTHLLTMVGMAYLLFAVFFPAMLPSRTPAETSDRLDQVRASGPEIAGGRIAGQLGDLRLSGPLLDVAVHPGGITLKPPFMDPLVLLADELEGVSWDRRWGQDRLTISYRPGTWRGPIRLFTSPNGHLAVAIERLVPDRLDPNQQTAGPISSGGSSTTSAQPARFAKYPLIMRVWIVGALLLSVPFLLAVARPGLDPTFLFGLVIIGFNVYWLVIRDRRRW
jgi:hypothetical protein